MHVFWLFVFICVRNFHDPSVDFSNLKLKKPNSKLAPTCTSRRGFWVPDGKNGESKQ
jgi:hypothetical protein